MDSSTTQQRSMSQAEIKETLENLAAEELFTMLRSRGLTIDNVRWPDRERKGIKGYRVSGAKTVDLMFRENGRLVGVDVIELHESEQHARQYAEMVRIVNDLELELRPLVRELSPGNSIAITWVPTWVPTKGARAAGVEMMRNTILKEAAHLQLGEGTVDLEPKPDFLEEFRATCYASRTPSFGFIGRHADQTGLVGQVVDSMAEGLLTSSKPEQLEQFDDARVLAIDRAIMPFHEDLEAALATRADRIPENWTAVYYVVPHRRPDGIHEVWRRPTNPPSA